MKPGRVALGVALLVLAMIAGAYEVVQIQARRTLAGLGELELSLAKQVKRDPFPPAQPGRFHDCAQAPEHKRFFPLEEDCSIYSNSGGPDVPASCQPVLDAGDGWVETWLRCSQRTELGAANPFPIQVSAGDGEAGNWLGIRLHTLPPEKTLELCRLTMAHARDFAWSYGPSGCYEGLNELLSVKVPCGVALEKVDSDTRAAFLADARLWRSQLPDAKWFRRHAEIEALRWQATVMLSKEGFTDVEAPTWADRLRTQYRLPQLKRHYDELIDRAPAQSVAEAEERLFNPGGAVFRRLEDCEQLPKGYDLLIELASINP